MNILFQKARFYTENGFVTRDVVMKDGAFFLSSDRMPDLPVKENCIILPGLADVHVHLREPGFSYKETIRMGTEAGAAGGYTTLCAMPNLSPVPDTAEHLSKERALIEKDAVIRVHPYGSITKEEKGEELSDMEAMADRVCAFSDDGRGVQSEALMREAMLRAKQHGKIVAAHCEVNELIRGGVIHEGVYAKTHGLPGICSACEYEQIRRDIALAKETGVSYHVCHISTKESVQLIRQAKRDGVDITCETAPHYLLLTENDLRDEGRFKMNPPLRSEEDRQALIEGLTDGTIDMIATDHAPHSEAEKSGGLLKSAMGIVGLETAFPLLYTYLVRTGVLTAEQLTEKMSLNPRRRFGLDGTGDYAVFDIGTSYSIDPTAFRSKGRATPFAGYRVYGKCVCTVCGGHIVYYNL